MGLKSRHLEPTDVKIVQGFSTTTTTTPEYEFLGDGRSLVFVSYQVVRRGKSSNNIGVRLVIYTFPYVSLPFTIPFSLVLLLVFLYFILVFVYCIY